MRHKAICWGIILVLAGCGGDGGGGGAPASFSELKSRIEQPTGDLSEDNAKTVVAALEEELQNSQGMGKLGLSSVEAAYGEASISCPTTTQPNQTKITCECNGGGTVSYDAGSITAPPKEGESIPIRQVYDDCKIKGEECSSTIDGTGWVLIEYGTMNYCYQFTGQVSSCSEKAEKVLVDFCYLDGNIWYIIETDQGYFAARGWFSDGTFDVYIRDKDGEWHCVSTDGITGTCEGPGDMTFQFNLTEAGGQGDATGGGEPDVPAGK